MKRMGLALLMCLPLGMTAQGSPIVIDFEGYSGGTVITNQYASQGVLFSGGGIGDPTVLQSPFYNDSGYPPHSGTNVIYSPTSGQITALANGPTWSSVGIWFTNPFYSATLNAYDGGGNLLGSVNLSSVYGGDAFASIAAAGIAKVTIVGTASYFTVDDFQFTAATTTPEPATLLAFGVMALGGAGYVRRRKVTATA